MVSPLPDTLPLFPLPGVALFPDLPLPLHIFEPRYRAMLRDTLAGSRFIGIVQIRPGAPPVDGAPSPIFSIGCAGRIEGVAELPGGRSNIVLRGVSRFHIDEELPEGLPYRVARVSPLIEKVLDEEVLTDSLARVLHEIGQIDEGMSLLARTDEAPKALVVNMLAQLLPLGELERQSLIEAPSIDARARLLAEILDFARLARTSNASDSAIRH
ncbi:MAG TPA: LON peptidase substrate-binding domain-containing protein [Vicinamibacteria bacterium]|nr:LON peptidase substrate-binding domain-containing protein [Vicinamibacteria bacterium]HRB13026.1 LON peptidase substrate-binding domain-containing protein [Vicinamibacteria bacterium]